MGNERIISENAIIAYLRTKGVTLGSAYLVLEGLRKNVDIDMFTNKAYDYSQQRIILDSLIEGLDVSLYADPAYSSKQMEFIKKALLSGKDVSCILDTSLNLLQMQAILRCAELNLDDSIFREYPAVAEHYTTVVQLLIYGDVPDLSWVIPGLSTCKFDLLLEAQRRGKFQSNMLDMKDADLKNYLNQLYKSDTDKEVLSISNLKRFNIFDDLSEEDDIYLEG